MSKQKRNKIMENLEFKGTKGEWSIEGHVFIIDKEGDQIAETGDYFITEKARQNAKLIAAAPDLLEALQWYLRNGENTHSRKLAEKAIEKALK